MSLILNAAGGLGIFLLAMTMMTAGLKVFGGDRLKHHLERWTSSPLRGVATYGDAYRLTYLRGPSGIIVMLAEALNRG